MKEAVKHFMEYSIFDIGFVNNNNLLFYVDKLEENINVLLSDSQIVKAINENCITFFNHSWDEIDAIQTLKRTIGKIEDVYKKNINFSKKEKDLNSRNLIQGMEIIFNVFWITYEVDEFKETKKALYIYFEGVIRNLKNIANSFYAEFIVLDDESTNKYLSDESKKITYYLFLTKFQLHKLVSKISDEAKKIIQNPNYLSLIEEYNSENTVIERKAEILRIMSNIVDGKNEKVKDWFGEYVESKLYCILNKSNIRHDNNNANSKYHNEDWLKKSEKEKLKQYDMVFRIIIAFWIFTKENF